MFETRFNHVTIAQNLGEAWFNPDERRFALIPSINDTDSEKLATLIEEMVESCRLDGSRAAQDDFLYELHGLHAQRAVLWPLGILFGRSAIGDINAQWFQFFLQELDPDFVLLRSEIEKLSHLSKFPARQRQDRSFAIWKWLAVLKFSSDHIDYLESIQEAHIVELGRLLRPSGIWAEWTSESNRRSLNRLVRLVADVTDNPQFCIQVNRQVRRRKSSRTESILSETTHLQWLRENFNRWLGERVLLQKKAYLRALRLLEEFFSTRPSLEVDKPDKALSRSNMLGLLEFAKTWSTSTQRINSIGRIFDFFCWMEDENRDRDGNTLFKVALSYGDVERFRMSQASKNTTSKNGDVAAKPMPTRMHVELKKIISDNNFAWARGLKSRADGRPLHWITWKNPDTGHAEPVFCEVLPRMLLLMLDLPLRNVQVRRLDSGEGDSRYWNPTENKWGPAEGPHADYWKSVGAKNTRRGVFREIQSQFGGNISTLTGFWINSNKTQDRPNLFDENSGYEMPWEFIEALNNLSEMREWQEKYNPVAGPLPLSKTPYGIFIDDPTDAVKALIPDRFYIFRYPLNVGPRGNEAPPSYKVILQFFYDALEELELRLNAEDPNNPITIITGRDASGAPKKAIFTLHGLRSSTITSLYNEGVPIAVLSKLIAGHATILMTLKYTKFEPPHVSEILTRARLQALAKAADAFPVFLKKATFEQAARMTARLHDDGLAQLKGPYSDGSTWSRMDIGICPNGGTLCHIGGELWQARNDLGANKSRHKPVPGGSRNCVRCRFLVTGLPFLIPLWGHSNLISARVDQLKERIEEREAEIKKLKAERRDANAKGEPVPPVLRQRIAALEAEWDAETQSQEQSVADVHATMMLIEMVRAIRKVTAEAGEDGIPMVIRPKGIPEVSGRESTRFELTDSIVQMSRFFVSLDRPEIERERDEFVNRILYQNGYIPITLAPLSLEERRAGADAMAAMLLGELGAQEAQNLIEGRKTLEELGLQERIQEVARNSIGRPLERTTLTQPGREILLELNAQ